ncbi:MAG: glucosidase, partial [Candidatus Saccharimonas sp.]|nr:glucosidase [Planctomycetaceae bacterium]
MNAENRRLQESREKKTPWKNWGPYLSERQWGTVREDYSEGGNAWDYFSHDQARSRAYHWGEDGLAGICDHKQRLCFALALWNGNDPIIKERLFGLTNGEGNHGEDVKEYYFYLDSTPTHSFMKYLYKYPQAAYPYDNLVATNRQRGKSDLEYELLDTGVFNDDRYFDVFVEYAKSSPEDMLIEITIANRGPEAATLHVLPTLWFRNTWSWGGDVEKPSLESAAQTNALAVVAASDPKLGQRFFYCDGAPKLLFTENDTNTERLFGVPNATPFVKDGINNCVVHGQTEAVNPRQTGTKVAAQYVITVKAGKSQTLRLRISDVTPSGALVADAASVGKGNADAGSVRHGGGPFGKAFDDVMKSRRREADEFYAALTPKSLSEDEGRVLRQALAGMMWSKQFYYYDLNKWLGERGSDPYKANRRAAPRNDGWHHMYNADVISMPDKWEYPWYAAWDLAFHVIALTMVDPDFGKQQLDLMLRDPYMHP